MEQFGVAIGVLASIQRTSPILIQELEGGDFHAHQYYLVKERALIRSAWQDKYTDLHQWLDRSHKSANSVALLKTVIAHWKPAVKNYFLNVMDVAETGALVQLITESKTPRTRLLITHAVPAHALPKSLTRLGCHLRPEAAVRRGQWKTRLHICSVDADSADAIDAAISNKGLYVLLAAAEVQLKLTQTKEI